jgi:lysophospholipase L1-like esterase
MTMSRNTKTTRRSVLRRVASSSMFRIVQPLMEPTKSARASQFEAVPAVEKAVVFLGDSITEGGLWDEWFPAVRVVNRGIGGNTTAEIRRRLEAAINAPAAVFLLCGTNDVTRGVRQDAIVEETRRIIDAILERSPSTRLYLQSVMPRAAAFRDELVNLNRQLRLLADDRQGAVDFVDLWPALADPEGALVKDFTLDSLHLNGRGYAAWTAVIRPIVSQYTTVPTNPHIAHEDAEQLESPSGSSDHDAYPRSADA